MAALIATSVKANQYSGEEGNLSAALGNYTAAAAAIADTIDLVKLPAGSQITDGYLLNAALGAASTLSLGWRYEDGTAGGTATALLAATATSVAAKTGITIAPTYFAKSIVIYATVAGGAITGQIDLKIEYLFKGTL